MIEFSSDISDITHPYTPGTLVRGCHLEIVRRPAFFDVKVLAPVRGVANLYVVQ